MATNSQQIGIVCPVPMGLWQGSIPYEKLNIVRYSGVSYIAKKKNKNIEPTVSQGWQDVWEMLVSNGLPALMCDYMPKETNSPEYYVANTLSFNYDSFNRTPEVGERFITPYEQTNGDSFLVSWKVVSLDGSALCNVVDYITTIGNAVTTNSNQTIAGIKTFLSSLYVTSDPTKQGVELGSDTESSFVKLTSPDQSMSVIITSGNSIVIKDNVNNKTLAELSFPEQLNGTLATVSDIENAKTELGNNITDLENSVDDIKKLIPTQATSENQLADKNFVNSSIQTATARFLGNYINWTEVPSVASGYPAEPDNNDYIVVQDATDYNAEYKGTWRFKYSGTWAENGKNGWLPEYQVNEEPLTAAQLAALNSGITAEIVTNAQENISNLQNSVNDTNKLIPAEATEQNKLADKAFVDTTAQTAKTEAIQEAVREVNNSMEVIFTITAEGLLHVEENNNKSEVN